MLFLPEFFFSFIYGLGNILLNHEQAIANSTPEYDCDFRFGKRTTDPITAVIRITRSKVPLILDAIGLISDDDLRISDYSIGTNFDNLQTFYAKDLTFYFKRAIHLNHRIKAVTQTVDEVLLLVTIPFSDLKNRYLKLFFQQDIYPRLVPLSIRIPEREQLTF